MKWTLDCSTYIGEKRPWNFEKFVSVHKKQHMILANLEADGAHNGINGLTRVRLLNQGILTKELDVPKSQIMALATLRQDFDTCVSLCNDFIELNALMNPTFNISETKIFVKKKPNNNKYPQCQHKRGYDDNGDDKEVEDRYYDSKEYSELTLSQKRSLKKKQDGRGGGPSSKRSKGGHDKKIVSMNSKMEAMSRKNISKQLIAQTDKVSFEDADDEHSESETETEKRKSNRNN
eukprot:scaffold183518_cov25-Attheya_sp.AAC.3